MYSNNTQHQTTHTPHNRDTLVVGFFFCVYVKYCKVVSSEESVALFLLRVKPSVLYSVGVCVCVCGVVLPQYVRPSRKAFTYIYKLLHHLFRAPFSITQIPSQAMASQQYIYTVLHVESTPNEKRPWNFPITLL